MRICGTCRFYVRGTVGRGRCTKEGRDQRFSDKACGLYVGRPRRRREDVMVATLTGELVSTRELKRRRRGPKGYVMLE